MRASYSTLIIFQRIITAMTNMRECHRKATVEDLPQIKLACIQKRCELHLWTDKSTPLWKVATTNFFRSNPMVFKFLKKEETELSQQMSLVSRQSPLQTISLPKVLKMTNASQSASIHHTTWEVSDTSFFLQVWRSE